jgi:hypothetical protein
MNQLESAQKILIELHEKIEKRRTYSKSPEEQDSLLPSVSWAREKARCWLYATDWYLPQMRQFKIEKMPPYYQQPAQSIYNEWLDNERDIIYRGIIIPDPGADSLAQYLERLFCQIVENHPQTTIWERSLRSFLQFLREDLFFDLKGDLEILFPQKMQLIDLKNDARNSDEENCNREINSDLKNEDKGMIIRKIDETMHPIDIFTAAEIIQNLVKLVLEGRSNARRSSAEALGFVWLCSACGASRILTHENTLYQMSLKALSHSNPNRAYDFFISECHISVQSMFGQVNVPISKLLYDYLHVLSENIEDPQSIFITPWSSLLRRFYQAVSMSSRASQIGRITFLTFMNRHLETGCR